MTDKIYIIGGFDADEEYLEYYFTNKEQAELCRKYNDLKWTGKTILNPEEWEYYYVIELSNGDNINFNELTTKLKKDIEEKQQREKEERDKIEKRNKLQQYAKLKAEFEGGDERDIYMELRERYGMN